LAHELSNLGLSDTYADYDREVTFGAISPEQYALSTVQTESESVYAQYRVAKELKYKTLWGGDAKYQRYRKGRLSDKSLKKWLFDTATDAINPKTNERAYDFYKRQGQSARDEFRKAQRPIIDTNDRPKEDDPHHLKPGKLLPGDCCVVPPWARGALPEQDRTGN